MLCWTACSEDDNSGQTPPGPEPPVVTLAAGDADRTSLSFTINPAHARTCAYSYVRKGETLPDADEVLASGEKAEAAKSSTVTLSGLEPDTDYMILAAVSGEGGKALSEPLAMRTLEGEPEPEPDPDLTFTATSASAKAYGTTNYALTLGDEAYEFRFDLYTESLPYLPSGVYVPSADASAGTFSLDERFTYFKEGASENLSLEDGKVEIEFDESAYTYVIRVDVTAADGRRIAAVYEGAVAGIVKPELDIELKTVSMVNPKDDGDFYVKFSGRNMSVGLEFIFDPALGSAVPAGLYSVGSEMTEGTLFSTSYVELWGDENFADDTYYLNDGSLEVETDGDGNYKISGTVFGKGSGSDRTLRFNITYEGRLEE